MVEFGDDAVNGGSGGSSSERIDQILSRLEFNDHELKLLLESIESRMSRLEPHVEELTSQVVKSLHPEGVTAEWAGRSRRSSPSGYPRR